MNNNAPVEAESQLVEHKKSAVRGHTGQPEIDLNRVFNDETATQQPVTRPPAQRKSKLGRNVLIGVIAALVLVGFLLWRRSREFDQLAALTGSMAVPTVSTVSPQPGPGETEIQLPGNLTAFSDTSIYARINGYLKAWHTDIGAKLAAGQLMAEIDAPDIDAQLRQATANLGQARANLDIAQINFQRSKTLLATKVISQEVYDQNRTALEAQQAAVQSAEANVQNLQVQQGFEKITAPFSGVVTRRNTDVGALINAGSSAASASSQELFHVARTDILRVYIYVPEVYSPMVTVDTPAYLELSEYPGVKFEGKVADVAGAIDPSTRTLQTEVEVPNGDGRLFPGAYAIVHLKLKLKNSPLVIPINTVLFRTQGLQVGEADDSGNVHLKKITVGRDFGTSYEVASGVGPNDRLIVNPSDSLADGDKVRVQNSGDNPAPASNQQKQ